MRVSNHKDDPGYVPHIGRYIVLLDGERIRDLVTADDITGEVLVFTRTKDGDPSHHANGLFTYIRTGFVQIFDRAVASENRSIMHEELKEANDLLRSAYAIAERGGHETNWPAFRQRLLDALVKQSKLLIGTDHLPAAVCTPKTFHLTTNAN